MNEPARPVNGLQHSWRSMALFMDFWCALPLIALGIFARDPLWILAGVAVALVMPPSCVHFLRTIERSAPIRFTEEGLETYDGFGIRVRTRWQDIRHVRKIVMWPGMRWLLLDDGRGFFKLPGLPLFVDDKALLYREVTRTAGEAHGLADALRRNGFGR